MTHTTGFEEQVKHLLYEEGSPILSLEEYLKAWTPTRIFAPGSTPAYSNYAAALAVLVLLVCIAWSVSITRMLTDLSVMTAELDGYLWFLQLLSLMVFFGAAAAGVWNATVVMNGPRQWYAKVWAGILALALLALSWIALAFHLIAFDVNY